MIIGICGVAGSGKSTAADFLVKNHGFVSVALADPLKRVVQEVYAFSDEQLWGPSAMRNKPDERYPRPVHIYPPVNVGLQETPTCACCGAAYTEPEGQCYLTPRYALQRLGTEWGRDCYPNTWVDLAIRTYQRLQGGGCYYDARYGIRTTSAVDKLSWARPKTNVVISDVRFINEVEAIPCVWRIDRLGAGLKGAASTHRSEIELREIPVTFFSNILVNNGTLEELKHRVASAAASEGVVS